MNGTIKKILTTDIIPHLDDANTKHAAVLIILYDADYKVIMTQKPITMQQHAGEISFPGGKIDTDDSDLLETALRETQEEIGLAVSRNDVIGQLKPVQTRNSGFTIIPFVAILDEIIQLSPNSEVDEILHIPIIPLLKTLDDDPDPDHRSLFEAYKLTHDDKLIWGASARMLKQIADVFRQHQLI
ncbi:MAG: NUDIX hydrolase [Candidatus Nitrosotenuis sp.]